MGERYNGIVEVVSSILIGSTIQNPLPLATGFVVSGCFSLKIAGEQGLDTKDPKNQMPRMGGAPETEICAGLTSQHILLNRDQMGMHGIAGLAGKALIKRIDDTGMFIAIVQATLVGK